MFTINSKPSIYGNLSFNLERVVHSSFDISQAREMGAFARGYALGCFPEKISLQELQEYEKLVNVVVKQKSLKLVGEMK